MPTLAADADSDGLLRLSHYASYSLSRSPLLLSLSRTDRRQSLDLASLSRPIDVRRHLLFSRCGTAGPGVAISPLGLEDADLASLRIAHSTRDHAQL